MSSSNNSPTVIFDDTRDYVNCDAIARHYCGQESNRRVVNWAMEEKTDVLRSRDLLGPWRSHYGTTVKHIKCFNRIDPTYKGTAAKRDLYLHRDLVPFYLYFLDPKCVFPLCSEIKK